MSIIHSVVCFFNAGEIWILVSILLFQFLCFYWWNWDNEYYQWVALIFSCYFIFMLWVFPFFLFIYLKLFTPSVLVNVVKHFRLKFFFECCLLIQTSRYNSLKFYFNLEYFYVFLSSYFVIYNIVGYSNLVWFLCVLEFEEHAFNFFWFWESGLRN